MAKEPLNPASVFRSVDFGFPQAVIASGRRTLYVSGQTAWDANRELVGGSDLGAQARQAFENLRLVLEAGGAALSDVVSLRMYVVDYEPDDAEPVAQAFRESFPGSSAPAVTWVGVSALAHPDFLIEIEAIAVVD
jgi:2-iminobutanoate/2-iminopropanoate deaminase